MATKIPKGLQEVIDSPRLTLAQKIESAWLHTYPVKNLDTGFTEPPKITEEEAKSIIHSLEEKNDR